MLLSLNADLINKTESHALSRFAPTKDSIQLLEDVSLACLQRTSWQEKFRQYV